MNDEEKSPLSVLESNISTNSARIALIQLKNNKNIDVFSGLVSTLMKAIASIIFVLAIIVFKLFWWTPLYHLLNSINQLQLWGQLSQQNQIFVIGGISAITSGIITFIISHFMKGRVKKFLRKAALEENAKR